MLDASHTNTALLTDLPTSPFVNGSSDPLHLLSLNRSSTPSAVAFVDATLPDYQTLVAGLAPNTAIYLLNPAGDKLSQISQVLAGYSNLDAVSVFSHGSDRALQLGNTSLNSANLIDHTGILQSWVGSFSEDGDLLFYGCDLAADATGQSFVSQIAALTGADVAASTDLTGSSALGGNWTLEFATGSIEASPSLSTWAEAAYQHVLATYTVNTLTDVVDANDGVLSLREAINATNASTEVEDTINFASGLSGGTITLANGPLTLTDNATTTIIGGNAITLSSNNGTRVFQVNALATAALQGLTISGNSTTGGGGINNDGYLTVIDSTFSNNVAGAGGGISNNGRLTVMNSTFSRNSASNGGGIFNRGTLTLADSTLSDASNGGGIFNEGSNNGGGGGIMTVSNSTISGNVGSGGIFNRFGGIVTVSNSVISGNGSSNGGGIYNNATMTVINSTLSANRAIFSGGNIFNDVNGKLTVNNSTLNAGSADTRSGGNISNSGTLTLNSITSALGYAFDGSWELRNVGTLTATNSLFILEGSASSQNFPNVPSGTLSLQTLNDSLIGDNGGPTPTVALVATPFYSPAINTGNTTLTTDQRGVPRPQGGAADYGAFEYLPPGQTAVTFSKVRTLLPENIPSTAIKVADIGILGGGTGTNNLSLSGNDAGFFSIVGSQLFFTANTPLDAFTKPSYSVTVGVNDPTQGSTPIATAIFTLNIAVVSPQPRTFVVTNTNDSGAGSLRQAIQDANNNGRVDTIVFDPSLKNQTITLSSGELQVKDSVTIDGDLDNDNTPDITVNANQQSRVFNINDGSPTQQSVTLDGLIITGGRAVIDSGPFRPQGGGIFASENLTLRNSTISGNSATYGGGFYVAGSDLTVDNSTISGNSSLFEGGGIYLNLSNLTVRNSTIDNNTAFGGGGIYSFSFFDTPKNLTVSNSTISSNTSRDFGGGIFISGSIGLTVSNSTISSNSSSRNGGGLAMLSASNATVSNSTISGNTGGPGGGISVSQFSNLTVSNSTISGNSASSGGGISVSQFSNLTVNNSTISGNTAGSSGGGIDADGGAATVNNSTINGNTADFGGGIGGVGTVSNSTISGNTARSSGGGIWGLGTGTVSNSTITKNTAPNGAGSGVAKFTDLPLIVVSSIIAGNTNSDLDDIGYLSGGLPPEVLSSGGYNLIGTGSEIGGFTQTGDITGVTDPGLGALANNGGPTQTHALLAGSLAINAGSNPNNLTTDQRGTGFDRVVNGRIDIGAFEYVPPANRPPVAKDDSFTTNEDTPLSGNVITNTNPNGVDSDPDGNSISVATVNGLAANVGQTITLASGGILTVQPNGSFTYTPASNYNGSDSFTYTLSDGTTPSTSATVSLTITPVNDPPTATNLSAVETYTEDTPLNLTDIVITDIDSATVTATLTLSNPTAGSLNTATSGAVTSTYNAGSGLWSASGAIADVNALLAGVTFTPTANFNGTFAIATSVSDGASQPITGTKTFTGTAVNDAPVAVNDNVSTTDTQAVTFNVLSNDSDVDAGDALAIVSNTSPSSGSVVRNADNTFTFTPVVGFVGNTSFNYTIRDVAGAQSTATVTITITAGNNSILGTTGNDNLVGTSRPDIIQGLAGNDTLNGGAGADSLIGGSGNDTYIVDALDTIVENPNEGIDTVQASITYSLANIANVENLTLTGTANINGTGNALDNVITGNSGINILTGGAGNDTYVVGAGDTVVENAGEGTDLVQSSVTFSIAPFNNVENLTLTGSAAINGTGNTLDNVITGNSANNTLNGNEGNDTLNGGGGNDTLNGGAGNDILDGGAGDDTMRGGIGDDIYVVNSDGDRVVEALNEGIDLVQSSVSYSLGSNVENLTLTGSGALEGNGNGLNNVITGNSGSNTLSGGAGNDTLNGGAGADTLNGGTGNDTLNGGAGNDTLTGGAGNDTFVYNSFGDRNDTITDFNPSLDKLDLRALLTSLGYQGSNPIADGFLRFTQSGSNTLVQIDQNGATGGASFATLVTLQNVTASTLVIGTNVLIS